MITRIAVSTIFFFFNDTATTEIYTLSLHDALPILARDDSPDTQVSLAHVVGRQGRVRGRVSRHQGERPTCGRDRKSTRLNSSHLVISYAVFCLKKKKHRHNSPCVS